MAYKLEISDAAERSIGDILVYMVDTLKSPGAAKGFLDDIEKTYRILEDNPYTYCLCNDEVLARQEYRKAVIKNYLVFYQIVEESYTVKIVSVMYGGRNYESIL